MRASWRWILALLRGSNAPESAALDRVLAAYGDGEVDLVTSTVTLEEMERYQGPQRPAIKGRYVVVQKPSDFVANPGWRRGAEQHNQFVLVAGHRIALTRMGYGSSVVLFHGIPTHKYLWRDVMPRSRRGMRFSAHPISILRKG